MNFIVIFFLKFPISLQEIIIFSIFLIAWILIGKYILNGLSLIPFLLNIIWKGILYIIDIPVDIMHRRYGHLWEAIDKYENKIGKFIDSLLQAWHLKWRDCKKVSRKNTIIVYIFCVFLIICSNYSNIKIFENIKKAYLQCEKAALSHVGNDYGIEESDADMNIEIIEKKTDTKETFKVYGVSSSLLVRDIPDVEKGKTLYRLHNDDIVYWNGKVAFGKININQIEAWIQVETQEKIVGWSRLAYLKPEQYEDKQYILKEIIK